MDEMGMTGGYQNSEMQVEEATEPLVLIDKEELERVTEEREALGRKMREAQAKRNRSKDGLERIRLKAFADDLGEKILGKEVEMREIAGRIAEAEREKARVRAEELYEEAQKVLADGWNQVKRCTGYLKMLWSEWPDIWEKAVRFRSQRDEYEQLCRKLGVEPKRLAYKGRDDITLWSGRGLQNPRDMYHIQDHWEAWLRDMTLYGRDHYGGFESPAKKDRWPDIHAY